MKSKGRSIVISFIVLETLVITCISEELMKSSLGNSILWVIVYTLFVAELGFIVLNINFIRMIADLTERNKQLFLFLNEKLYLLYFFVIVALVGFVYSVLMDPVYIVFTDMILSGCFFIKPTVLFVDKNKLYFSDNCFAKITEVDLYNIENNDINITLADGKNVKFKAKNEKVVHEFAQTISGLEKTS